MQVFFLLVKKGVKQNRFSSLLDFYDIKRSHVFSVKVH